MKHTFTIKHVPAGLHPDPEQDFSHECTCCTIEREAHDTISFDTIRNQIAFELEEQGLRILSIEGETIG